MNNYRYNVAKHMEERGVVKGLVGNKAIVTSLQTEACSGCSAAGACHAMGGQKERTITAVNMVAAKVGDRVMLATPRKGVLGASFLLYIVPVAVLLAGVILGDKMGPGWGLDPTLGSVLLGGGGLVGAFMALRQLSRRLEGHRDLAVAVVRVLRKEDEDAVEQCAGSV